MNVDILFMVCYVLAGEVYGYNQNCKQNQTIFVQEKSTAKFLFNYTEDFYMYRLHKTDQTERIILRFFSINGSITDDNTRWYDRSWEQRSHIESIQSVNGQLYVTIVLKNITMKDNGTYMAYYKRTRATCYILFVMQMQAEPKGSIEENKPLYVYAHPHKSVIKRPFANASMVWLLQGLFVNATASWIQGDDYIWIPRTHRDMDGKNVTYRAIQENGNVNDVNYTLDISYGPIQLLTLNPGKTHYHLVSGDTIPDIKCSTECKPPCLMSWENYNNGPTLSLGTVQPTDTGDYTCIAHWKGMKAAQKTISIYVVDKSPFTMIAIASLASVQALLILGLGLYAYCSYRQCGQTKCKTCFKRKTKQTTDQNPATELNSPITNIQPNHYEALNTDTRLRNCTYGEINPSVIEEPREDGLKVYENTENIG